MSSEVRNDSSDKANKNTLWNSNETGSRCNGNKTNYCANTKSQYGWFLATEYIEEHP